MRNTNQKVAIIGGARIPFTKSFGHYANVTNSELVHSFIIQQSGIGLEKLFKTQHWTHIRLHFFMQELVELV